MSDESQTTPSQTVCGIYKQVIFHADGDLAAVLAEHPLAVLLSAIQVTPTMIVLRFGPPPSIFPPTTSGHAP